MQRCSETIGAIARALAKAQIELANPEKVADRDHPVSVPTRGRPQLPLCLTRERAGFGAQEPWSARDCDGADDLDRRRRPG